MPQTPITTQEEFNTAKDGNGVFEKDEKTKMITPPDNFDPETDKDKYFLDAAEDAPPAAAAGAVVDGGAAVDEGAAVDVVKPKDAAADAAETAAPAEPEGAVDKKAASQIHRDLRMVIDVVRNVRENEPTLATVNEGIRLFCVDPNKNKMQKEASFDLPKDVNQDEEIQSQGGVGGDTSGGRRRSKRRQPKRSAKQSKKGGRSSKNRRKYSRRRKH